MAKPLESAGPAPTRHQLQEAALRHLARYASTEAGLVRVLDRRLQRWARLASAEGMCVEEVVQAGRMAVREIAAGLVENGVLNDASFAEARAARLSRAGRSRRAVMAHLTEKGVAPALVQAALPGPESEISSALAYARRRRFGPFRIPADPAARLKDLGAMARAGYSREVAERALQMSLTEAESLVRAMRRG